MNIGILALTLPLMGAAPMPAPAPPVAIPFTYVKVLGPQGSKTTWYPGTALALSGANGELVGLRPGYTYRFELAKVGDDGKAVIWPSIEVCGSLVPRPDMNIAEHPIPIILSEDDIERILEGHFLTKVYYLEDPDQAVNGAQPLGVPLEATAADEREALKEAQARGRLMIIVRAGERLWLPDELVRENVPGTIWVPSAMKTIPVPAMRPFLGYCGVPLFDPLLGPKQLTGECLYDGGDRKFNLGIGRDNKLYGLEPSDTSMEYNTPSGRKVVSSNRVCICVPRYAVQRFEIAPVSQHTFRGPEINKLRTPQITIIQKAPPAAVAMIEQPIGRIGSLKPSGLILEQTALVKEVEVGRPAAVANLNGTVVAAQVLETEDLTVRDDCTLTLVKRMDPPHPKQIGEVVTFYLSFRNPTSQPMTGVVISDSLTARLEYIEGSAKSSRGATFTNSPNEAASVVLRWVIDGTLLPGQSGVISFRARIR
jgi:uncharacterized repeat protein (TIGR01451 family)